MSKPILPGALWLAGGLVGGLAAAPAWAAAEGEANIFAGGFGNMVWTTITFAIVVYILGSKAWPPLLKALQEREQSIRGALEDARKERDAARQLLEEYQRQLNQARAEASAIVEEGRRDAQVVRERIQAEARHEADQMIARARREIQLATDAAVKVLYDRTADLAVQVAGSIVQKTLNADDHRALVDESIQRMEAGAARLN